MTPRVRDRIKFQARPYNATMRLYNFPVRWHDPDLARFVSEDR